MSGSYGALNAKYNTIYALYLQLQQDISGGGTLQEVLDAGNTANDKTINLTSTGEEIQLSANNITLIDTSVGGVFTSLNKSSLTSYNAVTGKNFTLNADNLLLNDGTAFIQLAPTLLSFNGNQGTNNQVLTKDAITNAPVWADLPLSQIPDLSGVLNIGAIASKSIDMNNFDITNIKSLDISTAPVATPELNFTRTSIPIVVDGITYYIGLYTSPP